MSKIKLVALCMTLIVMHGYCESNIDKLKALIKAYEAEQNKNTGQNHQEDTEKESTVKQECPSGTIHKCVDTKSGAEMNKLEMFERRLKILEDDIDEIIKFLSKEKDIDNILKQKSDNVISEMEGKIVETDNVVDKLKKSVHNSLDDFGKKIIKVNESAQVTINSKGVIFYGRLGSPCSHDLDNCLDNNSECRSGQCRCIPGFSFDMNRRSCVSDCKRYGKTFQTVPRLIIRGHNNHVLNSTDIDAKECKQWCVEEASFLCKSIDYFQRYGLCFLSESTINDVPDEDVEYSSVGVYFQRDCD